jgi:hypothetical protein
MHLAAGERGVYEDSYGGASTFLPVLNKFCLRQNGGNFIASRSLKRHVSIGSGISKQRYTQPGAQPGTAGRA